MTNEELYNQAIEGNVNALETLNAQAGSGDAESQYVLSCVYDGIDSPFRDVDLGMYWLQKSAGYNYEPALKRIQELSPEVKKQYGIEAENAIDNSDGNNEAAQIKPGGIWSFVGRIDRATYFVYFFVYLFMFGVALVLIGQIPMERVTVDSGFYSYDSWQPTGFATWTELIVRLIALYLYLALFAKRLHDCGHSGWWSLVPFCPVALFFMKGEENTNEYGPAIE